MKLLLESWKRYTNESYDMAKAIEYTAVKLDDSSHQTLAQLAPQGWKVFAHHMTIIPPTLQQTEPRYNYPKYPVGSQVSLEAVAIAQNDKVIAVKIESDIPTKNKIPHVTIATNAGGKPMDSNNFGEEDFKPLKQPIKLSGTIEEIPKK
jgi:hypothetical protein